VAGPLTAVWGPKGGTGQTMVSAGLAMHPGRRSPGNPRLVDLDAGGGHIGPLLQVSLRPSVLDYAFSTRTSIHPSGLHVLAGPARLVDAPLVTSELAQNVLEKAQAAGYLTVIDLDSDLRDSTLVTLEKADAVLLLTTPDLLSIYACRRFTQEAELIGLRTEKFRLVINRATARTDLPEAELLDLIGLPLAGRVPSLPGLAAAVNRGMMSATGRSNTDFTVALQQVADNLQFAGVPDSPLARVTSPIQTAEKPVGLIGAVRRWWRSL